MLLCFFVLHFIVILHLLMFFILLLLFIHIFFSTSSLALPRAIARFLHPFHNFSPAHRRVIGDTFISDHSVNLLVTGATVLGGRFFTHRRNLPYAASLTFYPMFIKASLETGSSSLKFAGAWPICLFDLQ